MKTARSSIVPGAGYRIEEIALSALARHHPIVRLETYWQRMRGDRALPSRADLDPLDIERDLLPWLFLLDVLRTDAGLDYHYRLVGTGNVQLVGRDATGRRASELFDEDSRRFVLSSFDETVHRRAPTYWQAVVPNDTFEQVAVQRGLFPLSGDGSKVDMLFCIAVHRRR